MHGNRINKDLTQNDYYAKDKQVFPPNPNYVWFFPPQSSVMCWSMLARDNWGAKSSRRNRNEGHAQALVCLHTKSFQSTQNLLTAAIIVEIFGGRKSSHKNKVNCQLFSSVLKFIYSEKATQIWTFFHLYFYDTNQCPKKGRNMGQISVAFSEYLS